MSSDRRMAGVAEGVRVLVHSWVGLEDSEGGTDASRGESRAGSRWESEGGVLGSGGEAGATCMRSRRGEGVTGEEPELKERVEMCVA